jgi:hypothetical protein
MNNLVSKIGVSVLILVIACGLMTGLASCQSDKSTSPETDAIRAYADPATETTLQGLSEKDLEKYTRHGNGEFKAAVTQEILTQAADQIETQLGSFSTIEYLRTETQDGYTIVHYRAKYTKGEIGVRMVFDAYHLVAGQWFE